MKKIRDNKKSTSPDEIAKLADQGQDISKHFTNSGKMMPPIQRVNVDFTVPMLTELDTTAGKLNVSRQALIKVLLRQALDQHYLAGKTKKTG